MTDASLISLFVRPLNQLRIPYIVTGGVASVLRPELAQALGPTGSCARSRSRRGSTTPTS